MLNAGADLIVTTAGLSVDPDDVTRAALAEGGLCLNCNSCTFPKCPFGK